MSVTALDPQIRSRVDLVLDAGELGSGKGSTVVDVTAVPAKILRAGVISPEKIRAALSGSANDDSL
jgi:tRNA A37 threonylcarbamoyladenosine synthetase subunit TsaC/SUA5/YrdC